MFRGGARRDVGGISVAAHRARKPGGTHEGVCDLDEDGLEGEAAALGSGDALVLHNGAGVVLWRQAASGVVTDTQYWKARRSWSGPPPRSMMSPRRMRLTSVRILMGAGARGGCACGWEGWTCRIFAFAMWVVNVDDESGADRDPCCGL